VTRGAPPAVAGLPAGSRPVLERLARLHAERGGRILLGDLPSDLLDELAADPPASTPVRLGAAVAVRVLREASASNAPPRWPARVDPEDPGLVREGCRMAALAVVALTGRTRVGLSDGDPDRHPVLEELPGEAELVAEFLASEAEILRRKAEPVDYPAEEFRRDLREVPERLLSPEPILPDETGPVSAGPFRFTPNHGDRVVRLYDFFRDKYGSPRGERRADLYLAVLGYLARRRPALEAAGEVETDPTTGRFTFRDGFLEGLLARAPGWFETA
jgi:hypothetical protein